MSLFQHVTSQSYINEYRLHSYEFAIPHFFEEMGADNFEFNDIKRAIETGRITQKFTLDPRGTRYEIVGRSIDERELGVICRI